MSQRNKCIKIKFQGDKHLEIVSVPYKRVIACDMIEIEKYAKKNKIEINKVISPNDQIDGILQTGDLFIIDSLEDLADTKQENHN